MFKMMFKMKYYRFIISTYTIANYIHYSIEIDSEFDNIFDIPYAENIMQMIDSLSKQVLWYFNVPYEVARRISIEIIERFLTLAEEANIQSTLNITDIVERYT